MFLRIIRNIFLVIGTLFILMGAIIVTVIVVDYFGVDDKLREWWAELECYIRGVLMSTEFQGAVPIVGAIILITVGLIITRIAFSMQKKES